MTYKENPVGNPRITFTGKIHLITNDRELDAVSERLGSARELGFDTETRPSFVKGQIHKVALLQLATEDDAYLIRLHTVRHFQSLVRVFENDEITKVGVAIRDDLNTLQKAFQFKPKSFIELQSMAKIKGVKNMGLKGMTEEILAATLSKGPKMTNWEAPRLTDRQLVYAATDAWIGLKLFQKLRDLG